MITAVFNGSAYARATGLWQYDYGQILRIQGLSLPRAVKIDFSLSETGSESVPRVGVTKDGVTDAPIPDSMLENGDTTMDYDIYAFVYLEDETSGKTTHRITMPVKSRPRPEAFDTPEDAQLFRDAIAAVNESAVRAEAAEKLAEAWAHGREDYPERREDNSKYYAGVAEEKAGAANDAMEQATKSAAEALQSEQAAKYSDTAAQEAQAGAEAAEMQAELHALDAAASASGAELAKTQAQENAQQASEDREAVQKLSDGFSTACEKAVRDIHTAGENQVNAVDKAGQKALENIGTGIDNTLTQDGKAADAGATRREIDELKGDLINITGTETIHYTSGGYIKTNESPVDISTSVQSDIHSYAIVDCVAGDKFTISGNGGISPRLWCFIDSSGNILSNEKENITKENYLLIAPENAAKLILNKSNDGKSFIGETPKNKIARMEEVGDVKDVVEVAKAYIDSNSISLSDAAMSTVEKTVIIKCTPLTKYTIRKSYISPKFRIATFKNKPQVNDGVKGAQLIKNDDGNEISFVTENNVNYIAVWCYSETAVNSESEIIDSLVVESDTYIDGVARKKVKEAFEKINNLNRPFPSKTVYLAPNNASENDKNIADIICNGVNDEQKIMEAIEMLPYGGTIYLLDGDFYVDSLNNGNGTTGIYVNNNGRARTITITGCTENKSYLSRYGASIHVTETAFNELDDNTQYYVFNTSPDKMSIGDWAAYPNNLNLENFYLFLFNSSKKVIGVNGVYFGSMGLTQIGIYNENYFHDRFYHVKPSTPVEGCIGVVSVEAANDEMAKIHMNCVNVGGLHTGIKLSRVEHLIMNTCTCSRCCYGYVFEGHMAKTLTVINCADEGNTHLPKFCGTGGQLTMIDFCIERLNADYIPDDPTGSTERQATEEIIGQWKGFISYILQGSAYNIQSFWKEGHGTKFKTVNLYSPEW